MADARIVSRKLEQIERYHSELQKKQQELSRDDLFTNTTEQRAVERMFENVIQACSDLAKHIAAQDFEGSNETAADAIRVLCEKTLLVHERCKRWYLLYNSGRKFFQKSAPLWGGFCGKHLRPTV